MADFGGDAEAFRLEARSWLEENFPASLKKNPMGQMAAAMGGMEESADAKLWRERMGAKGWGVPTWPKQYGGGGLSRQEARVLAEEMAKIGARNPIGGMGVSMFGPTLLEYGTEAQKAKHIPPIARGELRWCQGYSEPGAGSDLASLKTRAELVGDEFIVNGQKVWTSNAQIADWMFCLVRTDPAAPKHRGISYLLIDMKTPGITVRPLIQMTGDAGFNEVFFDNVRVPRRNLVGELNQGWQVANATLAHERNMLGSTTRTQQMFNGLLQLAQGHQRYGKPASADPVMRQKLAGLMIRVEAMQYHSLRQLTDALRGRPPGIAASINKLVSTELNHEIAALALEVMGNYGPLARSAARAIDRGVWPYEFMFTLGLVIGGGTSQIQKNIISERGLGMPREERGLRG